MDPTEETSGDELETVLAVAHACLALHRDKIPKASWTEVKKNAELLGLNSVELPFKHKLMITGKYAAIMFSDSNDDAWNASVCLAPPSRAKWIVAKPSFGDLAYAITEFLEMNPHEAGEKGLDLEHPKKVYANSVFRTLS